MFSGYLCNSRCFVEPTWSFCWLIYSHFCVCIVSQRCVMRNWLLRTGWLSKKLFMSEESKSESMFIFSEMKAIYTFEEIEKAVFKSFWSQTVGPAPRTWKYCESWSSWSTISWDKAKLRATVSQKVLKKCVKHFKSLSFLRQNANWCGCGLYSYYLHI